MKKILILGGGYAGLKCAVTLEKKLKNDDFSVKKPFLPTFAHVNLFVKNGKILHSVLYTQDVNCYIWPKMNNTPRNPGIPKRG